MDKVSPLKEAARHHREALSFFVLEGVEHDLDQQSAKQDAHEVLATQPATEVEPVVQLGQQPRQLSAEQHQLGKQCKCLEGSGAHQ